MPEGPEVRDLATRLNLLLSNKKITAATSLLSRYDSVCADIVGYTVNKVFSKGKVMMWELNNGNKYVLNHLKMTGWWKFDNKFPANPEAKNSEGTTRMTFTIEGYNTQLVFVDNINLAKFEIITKDDAKTILQSLGYDPLTKFGYNYIKKNFANLLALSEHSAIGTALMDQSVICGIGNYLRAEILWTAKINPFKRINELTTQEINRLQSAVLQVPNTIFHIHCTDKQYNFKVYKKKIDPYGHNIITGKLGGRTIYYVSNTN